MYCGCKYINSKSIKAYMGKRHTILRMVEISLGLHGAHRGMWEGQEFGITPKFHFNTH